MSETKTYQERYNQDALPLFRKSEYDKALPILQSLLPDAPTPKDRAMVLANILACLRSLGNTEIAYWKESAVAYIETLQDSDAKSWPIQPSVTAFENLAAAITELEPQAGHSFLRECYAALSVRFRAAFEEGLAMAFDKEARQYDRKGHEDRARRMGELYLALTEGSPEHNGTRVAIRNRIADMLIFHSFRAKEDVEMRALALLDDSLKEQPDNQFALSLKEHTAQRSAFRLQIDRFWHDTHNRVAPMKASLRRLQEALLPSHLQEAVADLATNLMLIDTSLRLSGATQGASAVWKPAPEQFQEVDPVGICREMLRQNHLDPNAIVLRGQPASWEIAPDYLGFALHQLLLNSLEAYRRRALPLPAQPVTLTIDYNASSILLNDAAGGISPHISDPFLPYLSEKGVHMKAGLGLLQARAAIEALDGALTLDPSQPKHGAAFLIQLPHTS